MVQDLVSGLEFGFLGFRVHGACLGVYLEGALVS